jgi:hypothetical protein
MNSGGDVRVAGHDNMFILELENNIIPPAVANAYIRFDGFRFNGVAEKILINTKWLKRYLLIQHRIMLLKQELSKQQRTITLSIYDIGLPQHFHRRHGLKEHLSTIQQHAR